MNDLLESDAALLKAAQEAPLEWVTKTNEMDEVRQQLAAAARHLEYARKSPLVGEIQRDLLSIASSHDLSSIFIRARALQSLGKLHDLAVQRLAAVAMPDDEVIQVPVRVHRRKWAERLIHIYRVEAAQVHQADDTLEVRPGDLFEVIEPHDDEQGTSSVRVLSRHITLDAANKEAAKGKRRPRMVRLVESLVKPITAYAGNGAEIVVGSTTMLEPVEWSDRLQETATSPLPILS